MGEILARPSPSRRQLRTVVLLVLVARAGATAALLPPSCSAVAASLPGFICGARKGVGKSYLHREVAGRTLPVFLADGE